jgi:hypothetical protein
MRRCLVRASGQTPLTRCRGDPNWRPGAPRALSPHRGLSYVRVICTGCLCCRIARGEGGCRCRRLRWRPPAPASLALLLTPPEHDRRYRRRTSRWQATDLGSRHVQSRRVGLRLRPIPNFRSSLLGLTCRPYTGNRGS